MPETLPAALLLVGALGLRHGFDADHLATIDALTRWNLTARPTLARWCGLLFSAGHGVAVIVMAIALSAGVGRAAPPAWLEVAGAAISISVLIVLATMNIAAALHAPTGEVLRPAGLRSRLFARFMQRSSPLAIAAIGALFAISFDTVTLAALFAGFALPLAGGGLAIAATLGAVFTAGMIVTDGLNGWWVARLIGRADRTAAIASRTMGLAIGAVAITIAGLGLAKLLDGEVEAWFAGRELWVGVLVIVWIFASFLLGLRLARSATLPEGGH